MSRDTLFFEFIKVSLGHAKRLSCNPTEKEWRLLFRRAQQQTLVGVCFSGIERLPQEQRPPRQLLLNWYAQTQSIEKRNIEVGRYAVELCEKLHNNGFETCILKGPGVAAYYPNPLRRQSGDIDVWIRTHDGTVRNDRNLTIGYVRKTLHNAKARYHHIDYNVNEAFPVELHFTPSCMNNPFKNHRLQQWFENVKNEQFDNIKEGLTIPTDEFNAIYLLLHIQKHILEEGIGLRQLLDYYYLLLNCNYRNVEPLLKRFDLMNTARAVMYVLQEVFGLDNKYLLCKLDKKLGRFLIDEIMLAGNFGKYDPRFGDLLNESIFHIFYRKQKRGLRFLRMNPQEVLWSPFFAVYQRIWRYRRGLI